MSYGDWPSYRRRFRAVVAKRKVMFGVGCRACISQGYYGCPGCEASIDEWQRRHTDSGYTNIHVPKAGQKMAGL